MGDEKPVKVSKCKLHTTSSDDGRLTCIVHYPQCRDTELLELDVHQYAKIRHAVSECQAQASTSSRSDDICTSVPDDASRHGRHLSQLKYFGVSCMSYAWSCIWSLLCMSLVCYSIFKTDWLSEFMPSLYINLWSLYQYYTIRLSTWEFTRCRVTHTGRGLHTRNCSQSGHRRNRSELTAVSEASYNNWQDNNGQLD